jgi:hypothetical protein
MKREPNPNDYLVLFLAIIAVVGLACFGTVICIVIPALINSQSDAALLGAFLIAIITAAASYILARTIWQVLIELGDEE